LAGGSAVLGGCAMDFDENPNWGDNSISKGKFQTNTNALSLDDLNNLSSPTKLPWSVLGDRGVQIFEADGYIHFTFAKEIDGRDYKISCADLQSCLSATSGVKRIVGSCNNCDGSEGMGYNRATGEVFHLGNNIDFQAPQRSIPRYNSSTDELSLTNSQDTCTQVVGSMNIMNDGNTLYTSSSRGSTRKVDLQTCQRVQIDPLDSAGVPAQYPNNDNLFIVGKRNPSTGRVYLARANSVSELEAGISTIIPALQRGTLNMNPSIAYIDGHKIIVWEGDDGLYYSLVQAYCGDGIVNGTETCDPLNDQNCQSNCGACNAGFSADINGICQITTFPDPDEPDVIEDIEDLTDFAEIIEDQHQEIAPDAIDPDTTDTTPDTTDTTTPDTTDTQTPDAKDPEIIIDPNCDEQINLETVYPNGSMKIGCFEDRIEINGTGEISVKLHKGLDPVKIIVGDDFANTGEITIFYPEIEEVLPAILLHIKGFYDIEKHGNLTNGRSQLEVNYVVNGATMALTPIGTRWTMKREELRDKDFSHLGEVKDGNVLVNVFDEEGKLIFSRNFVIGEKIYFTTNNVSTICAEGSACPFLPPIITEDLGADVLEGNDFAELPNGNTGSDGCGCMVVRSENGETTLIPVFAGLLALGLTRLLRRRKED